MENIKTHVFPNGLASVYLQYPGARVLTAILLVGVGSRFETQETHGLSRFYANICLQGNQDYPSKKQLAEALDNLGLSFVPTVNPEYSLFYFSCLKDYFSQAMKIFMNIIFTPALTQKGLENEKNLTLTEIELSSRQPQFLSLNKLTNDIFNYNSIGFDILGSGEAVKNITPELLTKFKDQYYVSKNCLLLVIGPDEDLAWENLQNEVEVIPPGERQNPTPFNFSQTKVTQDKLSQMGKASILTFGFPCYGRSSDKRVVQSLLINILSGGRNNQRLKTLQDKRLVTSIRPWVRMTAEAGLFLLQASCLSTKENEVKEEVLNQFGQLASGTITQEELDKAKIFYQNSLLAKLDQALQLGLFYILGYFFNLKEQTPEDVMEAIKNISLEEINELCQNIFRPDMASWVIVGPGY